MLLNSKNGISIITIVLNGESLIEETIQSVILQKNVDLEYIIIDGGSTDGTLNKISKYQDRIDLVISEPDKGIYHAINKGIHLAKYPYVGLIHCGDCYRTDALSKVYKTFNRTNADVIYGDIEIKEEKYEDFIVSTYLADHKYLKNKMSIFHPSTFVKLSVYKNFGVYNTEYKSAADYEFFLKLFLQNAIFVHLPFVLATFRSDGISSKNIKLSIKENYKIRRNVLGLFAAVKYFYFTIITATFYTLRKKIITGLLGEKIYFKLKQNKNNIYI